MVTHTATLLSFIVDIESESNRLAVSINFSHIVTVPVVFHSEGWSTEAVIVFAVLGGIARSSTIRTTWDFALISEVDLIHILRCGKCMRPSSVSMTTLLFLIKCNPMIGPVIFFTMKKYSANVLSQMSKLSLTVANTFSKWPVVICI